MPTRTHGAISARRSNRRNKRILAHATSLCVAATLTLSGPVFAQAATFPLSGGIGAHYSAVSAQIGSPVSYERAGLRDGGAVQIFERGQIHWSPASGAHATINGGAIQGYWANQGWENGWLGYPTSDELHVPGGASQAFQGGTLFWSQATGVHAVRGAILGNYADHNWEHGDLGFPTSEERGGLRDGGAVQIFQRGQIHWSPASGAHATINGGAIQGYWANQGWENGWLGYPTSDEFTNLKNGGASQRFQGGIVFWSPTTGAHAVRGAILGSYEEDNFERSFYGYPTTDEYSRGSTVYQDFEFATLQWVWYPSLNIGLVWYF